MVEDNSSFSWFSKIEIRVASLPFCKITAVIVKNSPSDRVFFTLFQNLSFNSHVYLLWCTVLKLFKIIIWNLLHLYYYHLLNWVLNSYSFINWSIWYLVSTAGMHQNWFNIDYSVICVVNWTKLHDTDSQNTR